jgi:potassium-transporting ATPase KdpC subunit
MKGSMKELRISLMATLVLAVLLCGIYPVMVWTIARIGFPEKADGSLISRNGEIAGSRLIAQQFRDPKYFYPRPSAAGKGYDATSSGGSNLGPTSKTLVETVRGRITDYGSENGLRPGTPIPADAVTASGSGLDPHISVANARLQAARVARLRGLSEGSVFRQIEAHREGRDLGIFGEERVNVVLLNFALDGGAR